MLNINKFIILITAPFNPFSPDDVLVFCDTNKADVVLRLGDFIAIKE
jgi:hypothetical protein